jgi:hypothetical protein
MNGMNGINVMNGMNLLDFPTEILFEFCKNMDFQSRVNFRQVCKQTNALLNNPKDFVSGEKMKEWFDKMKMVIGMTLLDHIRDHVLIKSSSEKNGYIRLSIDDAYEIFMTTSFRALVFFRNFFNAGNYSIQSIEETIMIDDNLFSKYKLDKYKNIFDHKEAIGTFLYDLSVSFVCFDQKKIKEKIMRKQISKLIKTILDDPSSFYHITSQVFRNSSYFIFSDEPMSVEGSITTETRQLKDTFFRSNIQGITMDLQKDLSRYFMDGEEAEQFLAFGPL